MRTTTMQHAHFSVQQQLQQQQHQPQQQQLLLSQTINQRCRNSNNNKVHLSTSRSQSKTSKHTHRYTQHTQPHTRKVCKGNIYYVFFLRFFSAWQTTAQQELRPTAIGPIEEGIPRQEWTRSYNNNNTVQQQQQLWQLQLTSRSRCSLQLFVACCQ